MIRVYSDTSDMMLMRAVLNEEASREGMSYGHYSALLYSKGIKEKTEEAVMEKIASMRVYAKQSHIAFPEFVRLLYASGQSYPFSPECDLPSLLEIKELNKQYNSKGELKYA